MEVEVRELVFLGILKLDVWMILNCARWEEDECKGSGKFGLTQGFLFLLWIYEAEDDFWMKVVLLLYI